MNLTLAIDDLEYYTTICGANNSGKTNVLRALEIFFRPEKYCAEYDSPNHKFNGSRGQNVYPEIVIKFKDNNDQFEFKKTFDLNGLKEIQGKKNKENLPIDKTNSILSKISFFYLPAINVNFPELITTLIEEIYDIEYKNTRFSGLKSELKKAFDQYINGTVEILNNLAKDINPIFKDFNDNWEVGFEFSSDVKKFRDLISNDINFFFNDKTNRHIDSKGSGLQRLGYILLYSKLISRITSKNTILLIDEPDIYLHAGLQIKLKKHFENLNSKCQLFITTHSKSFIDSYRLRNTFLLDIEIAEAVHYKRAGKDFYSVNTILVDIEESKGTRKIKQYLGIEDDDFEILEDNNLVVEGGCDKKYLEELGKYFNLVAPNIIPLNGVNNWERYLDFYNSFYNGKPNKPIIKILLDNDQAGREVYILLKRKLDNNYYKHINLKIEIISNYLNERPLDDHIVRGVINSNFEIEDLIYPELILHLSNEILKSKNFKIINFKSLEKKLKANSFRNNGILNCIDLLKNELNPDHGQNISFISVNIKKPIAEKLNIQGNKQLIKTIENCHSKYPEVKEIISKIFSF